VAGARPIARPPAVDQGAREGRAGLLVVLDQRHAVLTRKSDVRQERVVRRRPGFHPYGALLIDDQRRKSRLQLAEHDSLLDEAVVRAVVLLRQRSVAERTVFALEAA